MLIFHRTNSNKRSIELLKEFILPGGDEFCSRIHIARSVCRRAERSWVEIIDRIKESKISKLIVTDTISIPENKKLDNMQIVTVAEVFAEAIKRVYEGKSVSALFEF